MVLKPELAVNLPGDAGTEQQSHKSVCGQATKWQEKILPHSPCILIYCQSASEDVKVGGVLYTCVAMVKMISQIIHFLFP